MVFRRSKIKHQILVLCILLMSTCVLMWPYIFTNATPIEHDTFFHISRIAHLAQSIEHGNFLPAMYPTANNNFGYPSPLFYSDIFLIIPALFTLVGAPLSLIYRITVFVVTLLSGCTMYKCVKYFTHHTKASLFASMVYLFSNYHITDIYVRGALGELFALAFIPVVILGFFKIIQDAQAKWYTLTIGLTGLLLSHNLSFLLIVVILIVLFFFNLRTITKKKFLALCYGVGFAFVLTVFFTLPMLEQLASQELVVDYYSTSSNLSGNAMELWQYFVNRTVFGYSGNHYTNDMRMTVNIGYVLTITPFLYLFTKNKKKDITIFTFIGILFYLMASVYFPWEYIPITTIQFPWRLNMISMCMLSMTLAYVCTQWNIRKTMYIVMGFLLSFECIYHVYPITQRTYLYRDDMTFEQVLDGELIDPYYGSYYVVIELGGADYLPLQSIHYKTYERVVVDTNNQPLPVTYTQDYDVITINTEQLFTSQEIVLPLTWYKGYVVTNTTMHETVDCLQSATNLVSFIAEPNSTYQITYESTILRKITLCISCISLCIFIILIMHTYHTKRVVQS